MSPADPETKNLILPPIRALIVEKTSRSASACWAASSPRGRPPASLIGVVFRPTPKAQSTIRLRAPADALVMTRDRTFSKIRGAPHMNVGCTTPRFSTRLPMSPSIAVAKPILTWIAIRTLPNTWLRGSQRYCRSSR